MNHSKLLVAFAPFGPVAGGTPGRSVGWDDAVLEGVRTMGVEAETLAIMSGYRTPFYNRAIRNVRYSRHQWGDAADIFVDVGPQDRTPVTSTYLPS